LSDIGTFEIRDKATIRDGILRVIRSGLIARGVSNPNVSPDSDYYIVADGLASELCVGEANAVIKCDAMMPDTATGPELLRWLAAVGLSLRSAVGAIGNVSMQATATTAVAVGQQLIDSAGLVFAVTVPGSYNDGDAVPVAGVSTGFATNHLNGDVLTWISPPAFARPTVTVGRIGAADGLTGGVDNEDEETARGRLLARLANPPSAGNWQYCVELAEASSPTVQKAFCYPALQGPSTLHIAAAGYSTAPLANTILGPTANRDIAATTVTSLITPYVQGILPEYVATTVTTVANVGTDVSIGLSLPSAPNASPAGPGGGWLDGQPWPSVPASSGYLAAGVVAVTSSTVFVVDAPTAPIAGVSRIAWLSPLTWRLYAATVVAVTVGAHYTVTIDTPFPGVFAGCFIFPQSVNQGAYAVALLKAFALMGPGEKTSNPTVLQRAFRHPPPQLAWPYSLGAVQLRAIEEVGAEVLATQWLYPLLAARTPAVHDPPNILVPRHCGFYPIQP
jgi:hypothetical protein